ncbi:MAG: tRNA 2-thiouridine(34) synthase MnmA [Mycobacteriales bacterium]
MKVLAALSGGVDSAVAAARARDAGHDVTAVHLALAAKPATHRSGARGCCTLEDARDARRVADVLGVPFYVWDIAGAFQAAVIEDFLAEYAAGRTPNPCLRCNERIKFAAVLDRALALGFDRIVTGHYAQLREGVLRRARDLAKDQSYVLGLLTPAQLAAADFPLGGSTKPEVRAEAAARGLSVAGKRDSYDVCFVPDGDTAAFLTDRLGRAPGPVVDVDGQVVGEHEGAYAFTVGQRHGLGLGRPAPDGRPRYVLAVEPAARRVTVGPVDRLEVRRVSAAVPSWTAGSAPRLPVRCAAQLRAHGDAVPALAWVVGSGELEVELQVPVRGVAPGQAVVLYDGDVVLGGARVTATAATVE